MRPCTLFLFLLLVIVDVSLSIQIPCQVQLESGVQYHKIFWYRITGSESLSGLVMKDLHSNTTVLYKSADQSYKIGEDLSLLLAEFREEHCITYRCSVWPPVGYRIQESDYSFPQGCQATSNRRPDFANHTMDMQMGLESSVYVYILAGVGLLVCLAGVLLLLWCFALLRPKYTKVPV